MKLVALALYLMLSVFCVSALDQKQQEDPTSTASLVDHASADQHKDENYLNDKDKDNEEDLYDEGDEEDLYDDEDADAVDHQTQDQRELGGWYGGDDGYDSYGGYHGGYHGGYRSYGRTYVHHRPVVYHHYRPRVVRRYYNNYYRYSGKGKGKGGMGMMGSWS
jgi:hypothetical protein